MNFEKIILVMALIAIIALTGCGIAELKTTGGSAAKETETTVVETTTQPQAETQTTTAAPTTEVSYEITQATTDKLNAKFNIATPLIISDSSRKMKFGDSYVFAIGITNTQQTTDTFLVQAELKKAYSGYGNLLFENRNLTSTWTEKNTFETFTLGRQEQKVLPFVMEIKNLMDGTKPNTGNYEFTIKVLRQSNRDYPVYEYESAPIVITLES